MTRRVVLLALLVSATYIPVASVSTAHAQEAPFSRGFNFSAWLQADSPRQIQFTKYTRQDFVDAQNLGADVIRLPINLHGMSVGPPTYTIDPLFFFMLDQIITWAEELDLHLILDNHSFDPAGDTSPEIGTILLPVWTQVADRYKNRYDKLYYEILNEPHGIPDDIWNAIQQQAIDAIRAVDQRHTIIVGPAGWNSFRNLEHMPEYDDDNLIYTFHFYDPFLFTHQGATWTTPSLEPLAGVPFPYDAERMPPVPMALNTTWVASALGSYSSEGTIAQIDQLLDIAVAFKATRSVPLYCGEFGVYIPNSDNTYRVLWYDHIRNRLEAEDIAWTTWDYRGGFGIFAGADELFDHNLNLPLLAVLGLATPPQTPFQPEPLQEGFVLFEDFIGPSITASSFAGSGLDYYAEATPPQGRYAIGWDRAVQYHTVGFDLRPDRDLLSLVEDDFVLELWIKGDTPNTALDLRFLDSKTGEDGDLPWRMRYTIDDAIVEWDGQWQRLRLPLIDFSEHGAWDGEWFSPQGAFDWKAVDRFEIVAEHHDLQGQIFFAAIRLVAPDATAVASQDNQPASFALHHNYPNPFNPSTTLRFDLPQAGTIDLSLFNTTGQKIRTLAQGHHTSGTHLLQWDGTDSRGNRAASGVYLLRLRTAGFEQTRPITLVR